MEKQTSLFQRTSINFLVKAGAQGLNFALIPIYIYYLEIDSYGVLNVGYVFVNFFVLFSMLGQNESLARFCSGRQNKEKQQTVFAATWIMVTVTSIVLAGLLVFSATNAAQLLFNDAQLMGLFRLILLVGVIEAWNLLLVVLLQIEKKSLLYAAALFLKHGLKLGLTWIFLARFKMGIQGAVLALLIGGLALILLLLPFARRHLKFDFPPGIFKKILSYGLPFVITGFAMYLLFQIDQIMLKFLIGLEAVAIYGMSYKLGSAVQYVNSSFALAWFPHIFAQDEHQARETILRVGRLYLVIISMIGLILTILTHFYLPLILPVKYAAAVQIIPWVLWGYIIYGLTDFFSAGLLLRMKSGIFSLIAGAAAVLNIVLNFLFIPRYGMVAAAVVTFFSFMFLFTGTFVVSRKYFPISFPTKTYFKPTVLTGLLLILTYIPVQQSGLYLLYGGFLMVFSVTMPFFFRLIDLKQLRGLLSN